MPRPFVGRMQVLLAALAVVALSGCAMTERKPFRFQEATIASIHAALASGEITCTQLTRIYLDRIDAYNLKGPGLRAIITVNPRAMEIAAEKEAVAQYGSSDSGASLGDILGAALREQQTDEEEEKTE